MYAPFRDEILTAIFILFSTWLLIIIITSTSDLQPSTAILNPSPGKSVLNKFKPY